MITCYFNDKTKVKLRHVTVNALIVKANKILLVKRSPKSFREPNKWTIPGGYLDHNENLHQGLTREIMEESGYTIKIGKLFRINDNPYRKGDAGKQNVTIIFLATPIKKVGKFDHEISEIKWFDLNKLPQEKNTAFDHYQDFILLKKYLKKTFPLPILIITLQERDL